jgi:predicted nucleotidyltransferase
MKFDESAVVAHLRRRLPEAMAVYLFGSVASGDAGPESDVDLAVLNDGPLDPVFVWDIACELANVVDAHVDLVDLRTASTVLQHQIVAKGRRLWARDAGADIYEAFILSEKTALEERNAGLYADILREGRVYGR